MMQIDIMNQPDMSLPVVDERKLRVGKFFDQSKAWKGNLYDDQSSRFIRLLARRMRYAFEMLRLLPLTRGMRVLDAPCGCGVYSDELMNMGFDVFDIDYAPQMLETCRERLGLNEPEFHEHFREADIDTLVRQKILSMFRAPGSSKRS